MNETITLHEAIKLVVSSRMAYQSIMAMMAEIALFPEDIPQEEVLKHVGSYLSINEDIQQADRLLEDAYNRITYRLAAAAAEKKGE